MKRSSPGMPLGCSSLVVGVVKVVVAIKVKESSTNLLHKLSRIKKSTNQANHISKTTQSKLINLVQPNQLNPTPLPTMSLNYNFYNIYNNFNSF